MTIEEKLAVYKSANIHQSINYRSWLVNHIYSISTLLREVVTPRCMLYPSYPKGSIPPHKLRLRPTSRIERESKSLRSQMKHLQNQKQNIIDELKSVQKAYKMLMFSPKVYFGEQDDMSKKFQDSLAEWKG